MHPSVTGIVLAGGQSSRMGTDKAELVRDGVTMLDFTRGLLAEAGVNRVVVSRNRGEGIRDIHADCGPLGGIHAALMQVDSPAVLIVPVDMPLLQADILSNLIRAGQAHKRPLCYNDCYLPLYLPVTSEIRHYLKDQLDNDGNRKVRGLLNAFDGIELTRTDEQSMINTNTPLQWQRSQDQLVLRGYYGPQSSG